MKAKSFPEYCDHNNVPLQENMHDDLILKSAREFARDKVEQAVEMAREAKTVYDYSLEIAEPALVLKYTKQEILSQLGLNEKKV